MTEEERKEKRRKEYREGHFTVEEARQFKKDWNEARFTLMKSKRWDEIKKIPITQA